MYGTIWPASDAIVYYGLTMLVLAAAAMALLGSLRRVDSLRASVGTERAHRSLTDVISSVRATPATAYD